MPPQADNTPTTPEPIPTSFIPDPVNPVLPPPGLQPAPGLQPPPPWRPFRTLAPALVTLILTNIVGVGLFVLLIAGGAQSAVCSELAILLCIGAAGVITAAATVAIAFGLGYALLRRKRVGHAGVLLLLTYLTGGGFSELIYRRSSLQMGAYLAIAFALLLVCFIFFDWYLNVLRGSTVLKTAALVLVVGTGIYVSAFGPQGPAGVALNSSASRLKSELAQSGVTYLVPPPGSTYPQPYNIASESDKDGLPDYKAGAYFGIDTGKGNGTTLYEYPYNTGIDPIKDCGKISSLLVAWDGTSTCKLVTTLSTGTKIYASTNNDQNNFFIIKDGVAVIYSPARNMSVGQAYDFVDHLKPLEITSFLKTLHQQNPQEY